MTVRKQRKYIRTDSTTKTVRKSKSNRVNINAAVFFVLKNNYPKSMSAPEIKEELVKDGLNFNINQITCAVFNMSGRKPTHFKVVNGEYVPFYRNELKYVRNKYKWNSEGVIRFRKVLEINTNHKVTVAVGVKKRAVK